MRLFIGIALSEEAARAVAHIRDRFHPMTPNLPSPNLMSPSWMSQALRWSQPSGWHVTLQFLGAVNDEQTTCVRQNLALIHSAPVPVRIEGLGFFERAGVFWAGVALTPQLLALQQLVTAKMRNCGFVPEDRAYNPHITLARTKGRSGSQALRPLKNVVEQKKVSLEASFTADEFLLYESFPGPEGSRYEIRDRFPLGT